MHVKDEVNIVWLKRDFRLQNHAPLHQANQQPIPYFIIYIIEPTMFSHPDFSMRHLQFCWHSILSLNESLQSYHQQVQVCYAEAIDVFSYIQTNWKINTLFSYQESGTEITFNRDKQVKQFCIHHAIQWKEYQRDGIVRGIKNRDGWDKQWFITMHNPVVNTSINMQSISLPQLPFVLPNHLRQQVQHYPAQFQPAGEKYAWQYLQSFLHSRLNNYIYHISKPALSRYSCSRLSVYLSWGNLSIQQVYQATQAFIKQSESKKSKQQASLFLSRIKWHCHFIQKFETDCSYEYACINRGFESFPYQDNEAFFIAWKQAKTGFPLVDACMICLQETGWINFRMRAMLVSFACHYLLLDWKKIAYELAQLFLDYEPGIHFPQIQMQAGTTGINTVRIYNPIKQSEEHDAEGIFIKKWLPALKNVPTKYIHQPHTMPLMEQQLANCEIGVHYPFPILTDMEATIKKNRALIWEWQSNPNVNLHKKQLLHKLTRRKK